MGQQQEEVIMPRGYSGVRERRLDTETFTDLGGDSLTVASDFEKRCLKQAERRFSQGSQCQQINSMACLLSMQDAAFVVHSPLGCAACSALGNDLYRVGQMQQGIAVPRNARIFVTNLDEHDVINGGETKLCQALHLAAERYNPRVVFVFTSCASGIIGDDVDAIVASVQAEVEPLLIPVHCEGFKSKLCASGYDAAFLAIRDYVLKDLPKQETIPGLLNLFAPVSVSQADRLEIERILGKLDIQVNYIPFYASLDQLKLLPRAQASTAICKVFADEFMKELKSDYGIPYSHTIMPVGIHNTDRWLLGVAQVFGKTDEANRYIEEEHASIEPLMRDLKSRLAGKRVFVTGGTGRSFAAAALVEDFGMEMIALDTPVYDEDAQADIEYLNQIYGNFTLDVGESAAFEQANLIKRLKPDVFIGSASTAARLGIPTTHVGEMKRPTMGYNSLVHLGNKVANQLENPSFNVRLAKHAKLPYKNSWYEQNPFAYIKEF
jgi:nitrogenase molybdenum-iron protein alpha chain